MKKVWFKRKTYGWGWYPSTWQGWLTTLGAIILFLGVWISRDPFSPTVQQTFQLRIVLTIIIFLALIFICYKKGESPKWQWGNK